MKKCGFFKKKNKKISDMNKKHLVRGEPIRILLEINSEPQPLSDTNQDIPSLHQSFLLTFMLLLLQKKIKR